MMTTLAPAALPVSRRAAVDLAAVREQWGDLLAAINHRPAAEWPPREARGFLDQLAADDRAEDDDAMPVEAVVGRLPLTIREHPAPLNLDALDAALAVERDLFGLADAVAEQVQRSIRPARGAHGRFISDQVDAADPARWHPPTHRDAGPASAASAGSRAYGLHWAAVWLEGRALGEDMGDVFEPMSARLLDEVAATARRARHTIERALGRNGRTTTLDEPCPFCRGQLAAHTRPGGEPVVTCSTGEACEAPVDLDGRRRAWRGADLVGLWVALSAKR
ncbi:hypothetical protein F7R91_32705 [Streptomyces luteolifulvus]|uniref:Aromatic ring-opening dioxygenase LigA n=1 Tax=Streptomyces luteolifulvus TaxID=2615112 RepID=A0A6H9US40_9ACTN|nr:hypothetical protein [Streptomyces luteolifulvus]KAB1141388.1 hypothetical protein F7R91_32705 [Streptomyces luteolifulvus]